MAHGVMLWPVANNELWRFLWHLGTFTLYFNAVFKFLSCLSLEVSTLKRVFKRYVWSRIQRWGNKGYVCRIRLLYNLYSISWVFLTRHNGLSFWKLPSFCLAQFFALLFVISWLSRQLEAWIRDVTRASAISPRANSEADLWCQIGVWHCRDGIGCLVIT